MEQEKRNQTKNTTAMRKGMGITVKLAGAIVILVALAVAGLLTVVYKQMSQALSEKSEDLIQSTTELPEIRRPRTSSQETSRT